MKINIPVFLLIAILNLGNCLSQTKESGPIIQDYGKVWKIESPDFKTDTTTTFKAVFDIMDSPTAPTKINASIETAARFLNMHAQSGLGPEALQFALVVHNRASKDIITNSAYQRRFGVDNPNEKLILALLNAGGEIILCGQSSMSRGFPKEELIEGVQLSLSAMTALIQLQNKNYRLIKF